MQKRSGKSSQRSNWTLLGHGYPDLSLPISLSPSLSLPTLASLSSFLEGGTTGGSSPGLYESFLGSPEPLFQDLLNDPSRYEPGVDTLLQTMINGRKLSDLTPEEKEMLNRATLEFSQAAPPKKQELPPPPLPTAPAVDPWEL